MTRIRKAIAGGLAALTLGVTVAATATPADAQWRRGGWGGGWGGYHRGWGGGGWGGGWGGPLAAGAIGGLALGAIAAGAGAGGWGGGWGGYGYSCIANQPVYDSWGNFIGYQRVRTVCY
jgi:hypothetical protein